LTERIRTMKRMNLVIASALFSGLTAVGAHIRIDLPSGIPYTLQTGAVVMAGLLLGRRYGALSQLIYVVTGLLGIPVFAYGGGPLYILRPSFGYVAGFIPGAYITGLVAGGNPRVSYHRALAAAILGLIIIYAFGLIYLMIQSFYLGEGRGLWEALALSTGIYVIPDLIALLVLTRVALEIKKRGPGFTAAGAIS